MVSADFLRGERALICSPGPHPFQTVKPGLKCTKSLTPQTRIEAAAVLRSSLPQLPTPTSKSKAYVPFAVPSSPTNWKPYTFLPSTSSYKSNLDQYYPF